MLISCIGSIKNTIYWWILIIRFLGPGVDPWGVGAIFYYYYYYFLMNGFGYDVWCLETLVLFYLYIFEGSLFLTSLTRFIFKQYWNNILISTYINTKMCVCVSVCSRFSQPFGIRLGYPLAQMCLSTSKWF